MFIGSSWTGGVGGKITGRNCRELGGFTSRAPNNNEEMDNIVTVIMMILLGFIMNYKEIN